MKINIENISFKLQLNDLEIATLNQALSQYDGKVSSVSSVIFDMLKNLVGLSDWQKGIKVLQDHIDHTNSKILANFLLNYCLADQIFQHSIEAMCASPINYVTWRIGNYNQMTLNRAFELANVPSDSLYIEYTGPVVKNARKS